MESWLDESLNSLSEKEIKMLKYSKKGKAIYCEMKQFMRDHPEECREKICQSSKAVSLLSLRDRVSLFRLAIPQLDKDIL